MTDHGSGDDPTLRTPGPGDVTTDRTTRVPAPDDPTSRVPPPGRPPRPYPPPILPLPPHPLDRADQAEDRAEGIDRAPAPEAGQDLDADPYAPPPHWAAGSRAAGSAGGFGADGSGGDGPGDGTPGHGMPSLPPGPPGWQVSPSPAVARPRGRRQTVVFLAGLGTLLVAGLLAFGVFQGAVSWPFGGTPSTRAPSACATPTDAVQGAAATKLRVLNASDRRGLALTTIRELQKRGFTVPDPPGNDTSATKPQGAAVIRHGPSGMLAARTIATQVKGPVAYQADERLGEDVDLVLGQPFALVERAAGLAVLKQHAAPTCPAA